MPIRPIDIMKSQEASQLKHIDSQKNQREQVQISKDFHQLVNHKQFKTTNTSKTDNKEYRYDAKEKGNNSYTGSGSKKKDQKEENKKESKEPTKSGGFDILI